MQRIVVVRLEATRSRSRRGFTLIELLVVVSIIALLISILMPSLSRARAQAKTVVCKSNIRQVGMGALYYAHDYHDQLFPSSIDASDQIPSIGGAWARLLGEQNIIEPGLLYPYVYHMDAVVECPTNGRRTTYSDSGPNMFGAISKPNRAAMRSNVFVVAMPNGAWLSTVLRSLLVVSFAVEAVDFFLWECGAVCLPVSLC